MTTDVLIKTHPDASLIEYFNFGAI